MAYEVIEGKFAKDEIAPGGTIGESITEAFGEFWGNLDVTAGNQVIRIDIANKITALGGNAALIGTGLALTGLGIGIGLSNLVDYLKNDKSTLEYKSGSFDLDKHYLSARC